MVDDNDALGPMLRGVDGDLVTFVGSNDYNGVVADGGFESLVYFEGIPSDYDLGETFIDLGNVIDMEIPHRLGLTYDGIDMTLFIDGEFTDSVELRDIEVVSAGLTSLACNGGPGCEFDYLWIGSEMLADAPDEWSSEVSTDVLDEVVF